MIDQGGSKGRGGPYSGVSKKSPLPVFENSLLTAQESARFLGVEPPEFTKMVRQGVFPPPCFVTSSVSRWLQQDLRDAISRLDAIRKPKE